MILVQKKKMKLFIWSQSEQPVPKYFEYGKYAHI